jgi:hypothetical protein
MKCKVQAKQLKAAIKTVQAIHGFGGSQKDDRLPFVFTVTGETLVIEAAQMGAYVAYTVPCTALREGTFGMGAKDMPSWKLSGEVTLDANETKIAVMAGRASYVAAQDDSAARDTAEQRGSAQQTQARVRMPTSTLVNAAKTASYKSEVSDYDVWLRADPGLFQFAGVDAIGYGRYEVRGDIVQCASPLLVCLGNSFLQEVLKHVDGETILLGMSQDDSMFRLKTETIDLYHPTIDKKRAEPDDVVAQVTADPNRRTFTFVASRAALKKAVDAVAPVGKNAKMSNSFLSVNGDKVYLQSTTTGRGARFEIDTDEIEAAASVNAPVRHQYLAEFVKAAPGSAPLRITVWDEKILHLVSELSDDQILIDYMGMMQATE